MPGFTQGMTSSEWCDANPIQRRMPAPSMEMLSEPVNAEYMHKTIELALNDNDLWLAAIFESQNLGRFESQVSYLEKLQYSLFSLTALADLQTLHNGDESFLGESGAKWERDILANKAKTMKDFPLFGAHYLETILSHEGDAYIPPTIVQEVEKEKKTINVELSGENGPDNEHRQVANENSTISPRQNIEQLSENTLVPTIPAWCVPGVVITMAPIHEILKLPRYRWVMLFQEKFADRTRQDYTLWASGEAIVESVDPSDGSVGVGNTKNLPEILGGKWWPIELILPSNCSSSKNRKKKTPNKVLHGNRKSVLNSHSSKKDKNIIHTTMEICETNPKNVLNRPLSNSAKFGTDSISNLPSATGLSSFAPVTVPIRNPNYIAPSTSKRKRSRSENYYLNNIMEV